MKHTGKVEEQRIIRLRAIHKPCHRPKDILSRGLTPRIRLVVGENHHVFSSEPVLRHQEVGQVAHVINTAP